MRSRRFFFIVAGFLLGVFARSFYIFSNQALGFLAVIAFVFIAGWFFTRRPLYALIGIIFFASLAGIARVSITPFSLPKTFAKDIGKKVVLFGTVVGSPDIRDTKQNVIVSVRDKETSTNVLVSLSRGVNISYGEKVSISGELKKPKPFATEYGRTFRYDRYLAVKGVFSLMQHASLTKIKPPTNIFPHVYGWLIGLKQKFLYALGFALPEPEASLAGGIVAGGTQGLGAGLLKDFVRSGLVHVIVLSGYNVMIVAEAVLLLLSFLSRRKASLCAGFIIGMFVLASGAGASSVRAGLMALFALTALSTGRTYDVTRALVFAVLLMVLWNPLLLAFSFGFDLSVIATLGLILGVPLLEPKLGFIKSTFLREIVASTTSAQIAVLPLLLYVNGLFSVVALPANFLVLPLVPLAMATSAFAGFFAFFSPALAPLVGLPAYILLHYIISVVHFVANIPFSAFSVPSFSFAWVVVTYISLFLFARRLSFRKTLYALPEPALALETSTSPRDDTQAPPISF